MLLGVKPSGTSCTVADAYFKLNFITVVSLFGVRSLIYCLALMPFTAVNTCSLLMNLYIDSDYFSRSYTIPRVKKNQLDAQLILGIFRQHLHVSAVPRPIIRRYNLMYTTVGTYYSF